MRNCSKTWLCLLLAAILLVSMLPVGADAGKEAAAVPDYAQADAIFEGLYAMLRSRKAPLTDATRAQMAQRYVENAEGVVPDTVLRCGNALYWQTVDGITCHFSPHLYKQMTSTSASTPEQEIALPSTKSITATGQDVYLIAPYYGLDTEFEGEGGTYDTWVDTLAHFTGGKAQRCFRYEATVNNLAKALEDSAVVLIDSHGDTDTGDANGRTSYICLQNGAGITKADYAYDPQIGISHACYGGKANVGNISYYEVDGTVIANHMHKEASANLVWNGICFGMATDGICTPLRKAGVGVIYGYSQAVSFGADLCWMNTAMEGLTSAKTIADAIGIARATWGSWDYSPQICAHNGWPTGWINESATQAASFGDAFPVLVSDKDPYPQNPDAVYALHSDWQLPRLDLVLELMVPDGVKSPALHCYVFYEGKLPTPAGKPRDSVHSYQFVGWCRQSIPPCTDLPQEVFYPGERFCFGYYEPDNPLSFGDHSGRLYALYAYAADETTWYTTQIPDGPYDPFDPSALFADMPYGTWYYDDVRYAVAEGLVNGYTDNTFRPEATIRRGEVVSILYRAAGSPEVTAHTDFSDVAPEAWYADAVAWASANGIALGYADGTFRPDLPVTRAQVAVFLCRYAGTYADTAAAISGFPDSGEVPDWAQKEMAWAVAAHLINGNRIEATNYLQPNHPATRSQFAAILQRYFIA